MVILRFENKVYRHLVVRMENFKSGTFPMAVMLVFYEVKVMLGKHTSTFPVPTQGP